MPATDLKSSPARCAELPTPPEPYESRPGVARAAFTTSAGVRYGEPAATIITLGMTASEATGVKSRIGSKPVFL